MTEDSTWLLGLLEFASDVLSSGLVLALIGALFGAIGGAFAADKMATKKEDKRERMSEMRSISRSISMLAGIINIVAGARKQHIEPAFLKFNQLRSTLLKAMAVDRAPDGGETLQLPLDMEVFPRLTIPIAELQSTVYGNVTLNGKDALLMAPLVQVLTDLNHAVETRTELIAEFRAREWQSEFHTIAAYFSVTDPDGNLDGMIKSTYEAMEAYSKDSLAFSRLLHDGLVRRAKILKDELGDPSLKVPSIDFSDLQKRVQFPDMSEYSEWGETGGVVVREESE